MEIVYCDRCGKEIERKDKAESLFDKQWNSMSSQFNKGIGILDQIPLKYHLCKKCDKGLRELIEKFIKEGKPKR